MEIWAVLGRSMVLVTFTSIGVLATGAGWVFY